jgi:hypothetical protein
VLTLSELPLAHSAVCPLLQDVMEKGRAPALPFLATPSELIQWRFVQKRVNVLGTS